MSLEERLARHEVILLDGATGTELERRGVPMDAAAWSALAALTHGDVLEEIHADYIRAGADAVITNTFASNRYMLEAAGEGDRVRAVNVAAVERARSARDRAAGQREVWIAGSISPMSPYADAARRPDLATCAASFREQAEILATSGVDLIILEMMRDVTHSHAALDAALATDLPVWVGLSCSRAASGELVMAPAIAENLPLDHVVGPVMARGGSLLAIMHSDVELILPALEIVRRHWPGPMGAYPHSGHFRMPHWQFDEVITPAGYLAEVEGWLARGAQVVGGCCGIGPEHIRLLAERLPRTLPAVDRGPHAA